MFYDNSLPDLLPRERRNLFVALTMTLSQLHSIDWRGCGLAEYGGKGEYSSRQVGAVCSVKLSYSLVQGGSFDVGDRLCKPDALPVQVSDTTLHNDPARSKETPSTLAINT